MADGDDVAADGGGAAADGGPAARGAAGSGAARERTGWSVPEVGTAAAFAALGAVALGGLLYGIVQWAALPRPLEGELTAPLSLVLVGSTAWAGVFYGLALLAVGGVAWWHGQAWADGLSIDGRSLPADDPAAADASPTSAGRRARPDGCWPGWP